MKISLIFTRETEFVVCEVRADVDETVDCLEIIEAHTVLRDVRAEARRAADHIQIKNQTSSTLNLLSRADCC
jgi:hypothetical protein